MAGLGAAAEPRLFGLDEIADAVVAGEFGAGAQMGERADFGFLADARNPRRARPASDGSASPMVHCCSHAVPSMRTPSPILHAPRIWTLGPMTQSRRDFRLSPRCRRSRDRPTSRPRAISGG